MVVNRILNKIAWDYNQRQINKILPLIAKINEHFEKYNSLSDEELRAKTPEFKERLVNWESLDDILPEAFAAVKQACKRLVWQEIEIKWQKLVWDMVPYDVQLVWWIVLHKWKIAEMQTWEWKTLVATLPAYLNALSGKWVHVVTVNDYLASRDAQWMAYIYNFLWLSCGYVTKEVSIQNRKKEYEKDITYVENSELGFDYLRDNLAKNVQWRNLIWRPLNYAIVDEVDSILIDEARTPLIISQASWEATDKYLHYARIVKMLTPSKHKKKVSKWLLKELLEDDKSIEEDDNWDYYIDEKTKTVSLSSRWIEKLEKIIWVENIYKDLWYEEIHHIENALKANAVYINDIDYIVRDNEVLIVDENTGRVMPWRRYSEWLHQAIEAKEWVKIKRESQTLATITYQHFFKLYDKLSGMTGTASTEWEEFEKIYELEVLLIPTNKNVIRADKNDRVYFNQNGKYTALSENIAFYHEVGVPMLIWTSSIETSEYVSTLLRSMTIQHYVLNAKYHEQEANIVANAGKLGGVVVATNMAWRWTDIKLEKWLLDNIAENYAKWIQKTIKWSTYTGQEPKWVSAVIYSEREFELLIDWLQKTFDIKDDQITQASKWWTKIWDIELKIKFNTSKKDKNTPFVEVLVKPIGVEEPEIIFRDFHFGLLILGTEKHESRRIDNQLRGRSGRQWDPGASQFFVALDDTIMRKMWWERIQSVAKMLLPASELETLELTQSQFTNSIIRAQKQMEWWHFGSRKHLFEYDSVINVQRQKIYKTRDQIIFDSEKEDNNFDIIEEIRWFLEFVIDEYIKANTIMMPWNLSWLIESLNTLGWPWLTEEELSPYNKVESLKKYIYKKFNDNFDLKLISINRDKIKKILKDIYLEIIDKYWIRNIDDLQYLRERVSMYGYAQQDPLVMYKKEAYDKFNRLLMDIKQETLSVYFKSDFGMINNNVDLLAQMWIEWEDFGDIIQSASSNIKEEDMPKLQSKSTPKDENVEIINYGWNRAKVFEKTDDIEVFEVEESKQKPAVNFQWKVWPNDSCPCGSGKKYKKCCGNPANINN